MEITDLIDYVGPPARRPVLTKQISEAIEFRQPSNSEHTDLQVESVKDTEGNRRRSEARPKYLAGLTESEAKAELATSLASEEFAADLLLDLGRETAELRTLINKCQKYMNEEGVPLFRGDFAARITYLIGAHSSSGYGHGYRDGHAHGYKKGLDDGFIEGHVEGCYDARNGNCDYEDAAGDDEDDGIRYMLTQSTLARLNQE